MAWLIYSSLLLAGIFHPDFDKLGLVVIILYVGRYISLTQAGPFLVLAFLLIASAPFMGGLGNLLYGIQFVIIALIYSGSVRLARNPQYLAQQKKAFYICQTGAVLFGLVQAIVWKVASIPLLLDVIIPNKYDSIFTNPNPFGIVSGIAFVTVSLDQELSRNRRIIFAAIFLLGVVLSGSSSAMLLPILLIIAYLVRINFKVFVTGSVIVIASVFLVAPDLSEILLNKRLMVWLFGLEQLQGHYIFGIGFGRFQGIALNTIGNFGLHSLYMEVLVSSGIIGISLFLFGVFQPLFQNGTKVRTGLPYFVILVVSLVESLVLFDEVVLFCLLLTLAILHSQRFATCSPQKKNLDEVEVAIVNGGIKTGHSAA